MTVMNVISGKKHPLFCDIMDSNVSSALRSIFNGPEEEGFNVTAAGS